MIDRPWDLMVIFAALGGFLLALYIHHKKRTGKRLICPIGHSCDEVVRSSYASFFGIPNELIGMVYYGATALGYGFLPFIPAGDSHGAAFIILTAGLLAFLFSCYLIFIQMIALKKWCSWCLFSAALSTIMFGAMLMGLEWSTAELFLENYRFLIGLHLVGLALGLGGATITDVFFFRFLKDFRISEEESGVLRVLSQIIWFALAVILLSGIGLFLARPEVLLASPKFLTKMIVVIVIIVNGAFLNLLVAPRLVQICFGGPHNHEAGELHHLRRIAFALGAISLASWYAALALGVMRSSPIGFLPMVSGYAILLLAAIVASQVFDRNIHS